MPKPRKYHFPKTALFVTSSVEQGIMLPCNPLIELLFWNVLAAAQEHFPVIVSDLIVEGTHIHLILLVHNPDDVPAFMRFVKTESAHFINKLLGRQKRTVWCEGYDSPQLLTLEAALEKCIYLYTNPAKDGLESSIEHYPGISTWEMLKTGKNIRTCPRIKRPAVERLPSQELSLAEFSERAETLRRKASESRRFKISPMAWLKAFGIYDRRKKIALKKYTMEKVKEREHHLAEQRQLEGKGVIGSERLRAQGIDLDYIPKRSGKRMWCISSDPELRIEFIKAVKELLLQAEEIFQRWKVGDYSVPYPMGLYPPSLPKLMEPMAGYLAEV